MIRSGEEVLAKMGRQVTPSFLSLKFMQSLPILKEERGSDEFCNTNSDSMIRPYLVWHNCIDTIFLSFLVYFFCVFSIGFESTP